MRRMSIIGITSVLLHWATMGLGLGQTELDGKWTVVKTFETDRKWVDESDAKFVVLRRDGMQTITKDGRPFSKLIYKLNTSSNPKTVDFRDLEASEKKNGSMLGIYELDGNLLKIAVLSDPQKRKLERPSDFKEDGTRWIYVYARSEDNSPKTLEEGLLALEKTLGQYRVGGQQAEWLVPTKYEFKNNLGDGRGDVLQVLDGAEVVSPPFRQAEAIAFDTVAYWKRQVYDLDDAGGRQKLTRTQVNHNVTRYSMTRRDGDWTVVGTMLSNGVHEMIGGPALLGTVIWHSDGFEFIGYTGQDKYYGPEGALIPGVSYGSTRFVRQSDLFLIRSRYQTYRLAEAPDGSRLPSPDFDKPVGSLFEKEFKTGD